MRYQLRHIQKWTAKIEIIPFLFKFFHNFKKFGFYLLIPYFCCFVMKQRTGTHVIAGLLVRWRITLFTVMAVLAVICALLIPHTRINSDVTSNLPEDSQMMQGLHIIEKEFPLMDIRMQTLRVMFKAEPPADSLRDAIAAIPNVTRLMGTEQKDERTLYQFSFPQDADGAAVIAAVKERFGDRVLAEVDDNTHMPENIFVMLATGVIIALVIMFLMCPSFLETLLFLLAISFAIAINMGTNALLPSIYLVTHTLTAVLQMVLSMDFSIILMNRYRQEKLPGRTNEEAMVEAIAGAAPSILSSGLTTIVSMLMLCFMRLRIGADLGFVLAKGVLCSLVAVFTVLPTLILWGDKGITKTTKKVLHIPTDGLANFEMRFRVPLAILFVTIFAGSWFLSKQTRIGYSFTFPTPITEVFPPKDPIILLYHTADEEQFLPISERMAAEPGIITSLNYPYLAMQPRTASEWLKLASMASELGYDTELPDTGEMREMLDLAFYGASHPERNERMRMDEVEKDARELAALARRLLPPEEADALTSRFDMDALIRKITDSFLPEGAMVPSVPIELEPEPEPVSTPTQPETPPDTLASIPSPGQEQAQVPAETPRKDSLLNSQINKAVLDDWVGFDVSDRQALKDHFAYDSLLLPRTAPQMAEYLTIDPKYTAMVYRMARAGRNGRPNTLNTDEFTRILCDKILGNRLYASFVSKEQKDMILLFRKNIDAALAQGPPKPTAPVDTIALQVPEPPADSTAVTPEVLVEDVQPEAVPAQDTVVPVPVAPAPAPVEEIVSTPFDELAEMFFSGNRYTSAQLCRALNRAGIDVSRDELDLLYLYHGYKTSRDTTTRLSLQQLTYFLATIPAMQMPPLEDAFNMLRGDTWSIAIMLSDKPVESPETFDFLDTLGTMCRERLSGETYQIGYPVMYKEMKEGFPRELLLLTLLTIGTIFLIVALTFRSLVIPFLLVPTVLSAVWINVYASGLGGHTMLYISYLIVQSILMGATIDYSILFTHYYRECRQTLDKAEALKATYRKSTHTILTSGLILSITPSLMVYSITDPMISSILRCISLGAAAAILIIFFLLPATLVIMDKWVVKKK